MWDPAKYLTFADHRSRLVTRNESPIGLVCSIDERFARKGDPGAICRAGHFAVRQSK